MTDTATQERSSEWAAFDLRDDGDRHYLAGEPIHCGEAVMLQSIKYEYDADGNERVVRLETGVRVRYELVWIKDWSGLNERVRLHAQVGGHEFVAPLEQWMRFRWPERRRV